MTSSSSPISLSPLDSHFSPVWSPGTEGSKVSGTWDQGSGSFMRLSPFVSPMPLQTTMSRVYQFDHAQEAFLDGPDGTTHPFVPSEPCIPDQLLKFGAAVKISVTSATTSGTADITGSVQAGGSATLETDAPEPEEEKKKSSKSKGKRKASKEKHSSKEGKSSKSSKGVFDAAPVEISTAGTTQ